MPALLQSPLARRTLLALAVLGAASAVWRASARRPEAPEPAKAPATAFYPSKEQWGGLKVAEVRTLPFRSTLSTDGSIAFDEDALTPVFSPYSGRVSRVIARLGDTVKKGAPLLAVEAAEFVQGQSDVATTKAAFDTATATEKRQHDLYDAGAGALKDWRQAQADLAAARSAYFAARGRLAILGKTAAEIDTLERGATGTTEAVVAAPIAGTITQRQVGVGQYITNGAANPLLTIGDLSRVWLVANVREGDAPALRLGQTAEVEVLALPGRKFKGKVAWIGAAVDPVTHRLPVRLELANRDGLLKPMMFASFAIATGEAVEAPAVPESAVVSEGERARVFVVAGDGGIAGREISIGRRQQGMVEVVAGLRAGEKVVAAGSLFVDRATAGD